MLMTLPAWLKGVVAAVVAAGGAAFVIALACPTSPIPKAVNDLTLIATLVTLVLYVYYTYVLATDAATPSASITFQAVPEDPLHILVFVQNAGKISLRCFANLNVTVRGADVGLDGFYGGQSPFDVQPYSVVRGHFDIRELLVKAGVSEQDMLAAAQVQDRNALYMNVEFWYSPFGTTNTVTNPRQPHYFDFARRVLVADF